MACNWPAFWASLNSSPSMCRVFSASAAALMACSVEAHSAVWAHTMDAAGILFTGRPAGSYRSSRVSLLRRRMWQVHSQPAGMAGWDFWMTWAGAVYPWPSQDRHPEAQQLRLQDFSGVFHHAKSGMQCYRGLDAQALHLESSAVCWRLRCCSSLLCCTCRRLSYPRLKVMHPKQGSSLQLATYQDCRRPIR